MNQVVIAPLAVSLMIAAGAIVLRNSKWIRYWSGFGVLGYTVSVTYLVARVGFQKTLTFQAGSWTAPYGITLVADSLTSLMLLITAVVSLSSLIYSHNLVEESGIFNVFMHFMVAGMTGAFLAGDLFNLFVWLEVTLMSSYVMVSFYGGRKETYTTLKYVAINLIGSSLMLISIGGLYSVTGTLNIADIGLRITEASSYGIDTAAVPGLLMILFGVFALKSGLFPFHFWVPETYESAPAPATAMMAGISKKIGIYAVIRIFLGVVSGAALQIPGTGWSFSGLLGWSMILMASGAMITGGLAAAGSQKLDTLLAYSSIGQVGFIYLLLGAGMLNPEARAFTVTAAIVYLLHHAIAKSSLFLSSGLIKEVTGTYDLRKLSGLSSKCRELSASFFITGFSLVGIPPLFGFFGKLGFFQGLLRSGFEFILPLAVFSSIMTLIYISRSWKEVFWGESIPVTNFDSMKLLAVLLGALIIISVGIGFEAVFQASEAASTAAVNPETYIEAVLEVTE